MFFKWIAVLTLFFTSFSTGIPENTQALDAGAELLYSLLEIENAPSAAQAVSPDHEDIPVNSAEEDPPEILKDYSQDLTVSSEKSEISDVDALSEEISHEIETEKTEDNEKDNYNDSEHEQTTGDSLDENNGNRQMSTTVPSLPTPLPIKRPSSTESEANLLTLKQNGRMIPRIPKLVTVPSKQKPPVRAPVFTPRSMPAFVLGSRNKPMLKQNPQGKMFSSEPTTLSINTPDDLDDVQISSHEADDPEPLTEIKYANPEKNIDSQEYQDINSNQQSHEVNGNAQGFDLLSAETSEADISTEMLPSNVTVRGKTDDEPTKVTSISISVEQSEEVKEKDLTPNVNILSQNTSSENQEGSGDKKFVISSVQTSKSVEESGEDSEEIDNATKISVATETSENAQSTIVYQSFQTSMSISKSVSEIEGKKEGITLNNTSAESGNQSGQLDITKSEEQPTAFSKFPTSLLVSNTQSIPNNLSNEAATSKTFVTQISLISETSLDKSSLGETNFNEQTTSQQFSLYNSPAKNESTITTTPNSSDSKEEISPLFEWPEKSLTGVFYDRISGKYITIGSKMGENSKTTQSSSTVVTSFSTSKEFSVQTEVAVGKSLNSAFDQTNQKNTSADNISLLPTEDPKVLEKLLPKSFSTEDPQILAKMLPKSYPTEDPKILAKLLPKSFPTEDPSILAKLLPQSFLTSTAGPVSLLPTEDPSVLAKLLPKSFSTEDPHILAKLLPKSYSTEDPSILAKLLPESFRTSSAAPVSSEEPLNAQKSDKLSRTFFDKVSGKNITINLLTEDPKILAAMTPPPRNKTENIPQTRTIFSKGRNITIPIITEDPSILAAMTPPSTSGPNIRQPSPQTTLNSSSSLKTTPTQTMRALVTPKQIGKLPIITRHNVTRKPFLPVRSSTKNPRPPPTFKKISDILNRSRAAMPKRNQYGRHQSHEGNYQEDPEKRYTTEAASTTTMRTTTTLPPYFRWGRSLVLSGNLKISDGVDWVEELRDATTSQFKKIANEIEGSLYSLFKKSAVIGPKFKGVQIEGFSKGVIVDYTVFLNEDTRGTVPQMLMESYREGLSNGTYLGNLKVDPLYVAFQIIKQEEIHAPDSVEEAQGFPYWAIAIVGIGAACLLFLAVLLIVKAYNKRSVRRKYGAPLTEDSIQDRRKSLEKQAYHNAGAEGLYDMGSIGELWNEKKSKQKPGSTSTYSNQRSLPYGSNQTYQGGLYSANPYQTTDLFTQDFYQTHQPAPKYYDAWNEWDEPYGSHRSRSSYKLDYDTTF